MATSALRFGRWLTRAVGLGALALATSPALAADATPEQLQFAAHEHDLGYRAYVAKQFDEAANHFENAFFSAPNPAELRSAVRARRDAGELARAGTLAAIAQRKYPGDPAISKLVEETLAAARPKTYEVHVTSSEECNAAVDSKIVAVEKATDFRFYVDPGPHEVLVGWSDDRSTKVGVEASAGGSRELNLTPPPRPAPAPAVDTHPVAAPVAPASSKPFGPAVFLIGAGLTAVGAGVTIWSALDTQNNPGTAAVKADCVGQGTSCPQYQQGLSSQLRTNVLIAASGGVALVTAVIGIFFTQWSQAPQAAPATGLRLEPSFGLGQGGLAGTF